MSRAGSPNRPGFADAETGALAHPESLPVAATEGLGGPLGAHASKWSLSAPARLRWILAGAALPMVAAVLRQGNCIDNGWVGNGQFWRGCYSGIASSFALSDLGAGLPGWAAGRGVNEPPLISALLSAIGGLVGQGPWLADSRWYMGIWAVALTLTLIACLAALARLRPGRLDLVAQLALTPLLITSVFLSIDLIPVALALWAMVAWRSGRTVLTGVLLGLSMTGHLWGAALAAGLALTLARVAPDGWDGQEWYPRSRVLLTLATALSTLALLLAGMLVINPTIVVRPITSWFSATPGYGSLWMIPQLAGGQPVNSVLTAGLGLTGIVVALVLAYARMRTGEPSSWPTIVAILIGVSALMASSVPIQLGLVLGIFAIAAGIRWRDHLIFAAGEAVHGMGVWLYIGYGTNADKGLPSGWYAGLLIMRALIWGYLIWRIWHLDRARIASLSPQPGKLVQSVPAP